MEKVECCGLHILVHTNTTNKVCFQQTTNTLSTQNCIELICAPASHAVMSTLMFWNKQNANSNQANGTDGTKNGKKEWLHSPDALVNGHVAYLVKVSQPTANKQSHTMLILNYSIKITNY